MSESENPVKALFKAVIPFMWWHGVWITVCASGYGLNVKPQKT